MKKHITFFVALTGSLIVGTVVVSCRSSASRNSTIAQQMQTTVEQSYRQTTHATTQSSEAEETRRDGSWYRVTHTYDTSKPTDSTTGLPPVAAVIVEAGGEVTTTGRQSNHALQHNGEEWRETTLRNITESEETLQKNVEAGILPDVDKGINKAIGGGIFLAVAIILITVCIRIYKKYYHGR
ncbi:hypothetical protein D0T50_09865 [Bacteroides sp. 214]|uniref:hypothetical protein n=1 Tax=Bacteroides sp. 214 TaxID=2302935 RepID=UPI0013D60FE2|nr:hypothetical protein [Bacteroides sp. 214]NDW13199.1 hypothetical protein [Bacteroides sp. 214]